MISTRIERLIEGTRGAREAYLSDVRFHQQAHDLDEQYGVILQALGDTGYHPSLSPSRVADRYARLMLARYLQQSQDSARQQEAALYRLSRQPPDLTKIADAVGVLHEQEQP